MRKDNRNAVPSATAKRATAATLVALFVAGSVLGGVQSASADPPSGSPGAGYSYGVVPNTLPSGTAEGGSGGAYYGAANPDQCTSSGGYSNSTTEFATYGNAYGDLGPTATNPNSGIGVVRVCEPYYSSADDAIFVPAYITNLTSASGDSVAWPFAQIGNVGSSPTEVVPTGDYTVVCSSSEWSDSTTQYTHSVGGVTSFSYNAAGGTAWGNVEIASASGGGSGCNYLVSFTVGVSFAQGTGVIGAAVMSWSAYGAADPTIYSDPGDGQTACSFAGANLSDQCAAYITPDPTTVASCGPQPTFNPFDASTYAQFGPWLVFWPECWFIPKGGFDSTGAIGAAFSASGVGQLQTDINQIAEGLSIPESCGLIFDASGLVIGGTTWAGLNINTCDWTWSGLSVLKQIIGWAFAIGFGWWAIRFALATITGIYNKKTPDPGAAGDGGDAS